MSKLTCPIVRDLLPLYIDQVTSAETTQAVEEHLAACPACHRERDALQGDLPTPPPQETDTARQFGTMMRRIKRKQAWKASLAVLLVVVVVVGGLFLLFGHPLLVIDNEGAKIHRLYPYEDSRGNKRFFVLYERPLFLGCDELAASVKQEGGKDILQLNMKRGLFSRPAREHLEWNESVVLPDWADIAEVRLGDEVLWTKEGSGGDPVPDYVYTYDEVGSSQRLLSWSVELDGEENYSDCPAPFVQAIYRDGSQIIWDLDGNVLQETP